MKWLDAAAPAALAFVLTCPVQVHASPEGEGAWEAAPTSCVVEQFALRAYVTALRSGVANSPARDPARLSQAITPVCRQAIQNGRWPGLATELLSRVPDEPALQNVLCQIAPPEALSVIATWEGKEGDARRGYDVACALALFRYSPAEFKRVVWPRLTAGTGCAFAPLAVPFIAALRPDERLGLLPLLDFATQTRARDRDRLYDLLCQHPAAREQTPCQAPAALETEWAREARLKRAVPGIVLHSGLALLFAVAASLLWKFRRQSWPAVGMGVAATIATSATLTWIHLLAPAAGSAAPGGPAATSAIFVVLSVAAVSGAGAWTFLRRFAAAALPWCLAHAIVYALARAIHAWTAATNQLC